MSLAVLAPTVLLLVPSGALGASSTGGASIPDPAAASAASCASGESWACRRGQTLTIAGTGMDGVTRVIFQGGKGTKDDRATAPSSAEATSLKVTVPRDARSGALRLVSPAGGSSRTQRLRILTSPVPQADVTGATTDLAPGQALIAGSRKRMLLQYTATVAGTVEAVRVDSGQVVRSWPVDAGQGEVRWDGTVGGSVVTAGRYVLRLAGQPTASQASSGAVQVLDAIFPIRGKHDLGQSATNDFGGGRGHGGQDMFARCGVPLVAARPGTVQFEAVQSRAGNYVVLQDKTGASYTYMHMRDRALVKKGDRVRAGQRIGYVGDSGRASGCHLHFELWTAPGWYEGGEGIDPLPELRRWDSFS
ncbi:peptidoglycan DD-metalloendopeptidase family protein [Conexibacter sp. W3-3-2]|uniref:M23 family metallopeptidase n=1 Tax=Conexibacter sp. W3-3-2 TaxID=2675227 RepID=UPI0012B85161|nr:M23 family metallopeptidase [Conexibacter sp. W3-3-2]MTD47491.1 peptidoglycan DD-metalloendopeptidase family protein [Conexibacter sp. W3-3-2]